MSAKLRTPCEMLLGTMARAYESQCGPIESEFFELGGNATLCKATVVFICQSKEEITRFFNRDLMLPAVQVILRRCHVP